MPALHADAIRAAAAANGIHAVGWFAASDFEGYIATIRDTPEYHGFAYRPLDVFLRAGRVEQGVRTLVVLAMDYFVERVDSSASLRLSNYSRACWSTVRPKARAMVSYLRGLGHHAEEIDVPQRAAACRAALGFVGRNTMLYVDGLGSYVGIASIGTDAQIDDASAAPERAAHPSCANCRACVASCPVSAIHPDGYRIDPLRCLSFLNRHPDEALGVLPGRPELLGGWLHGCESCQDVCPLNRMARHPGGAVVSPEIEIEGLRLTNTAAVSTQAVKGKLDLVTSPGYRRYLARLLEGGAR